jgi:hypothetical protein
MQRAPHAVTRTAPAKVVQKIPEGNCLEVIDFLRLEQKSFQTSKHVFPERVGASGWLLIRLFPLEDHFPVENGHVYLRILNLGGVNMEDVG